MKIYKFGAKWCGSCKVLQGAIDGWDESIKSQLINVDAEKDFELSRKYNVRGLPTIIVADDSGNEVKRFGMQVTESDLKEYI